MVDIRISRHDPHNIEIKTHFSVPHRFDGQVDVFLFLPQNFQAQSVHKEKLMSDFCSRSRLAVHIPHDTEMSSLRTALEELLDRIGSEESVELARRFAGNATEILRVLRKRQKKKLYRDSPNEILSQMAGMGDWVDEVRRRIREADKRSPLLLLLDEYLSYLFVRYLVDLKEFDAKAGPDNPNTEPFRQKLRDLEANEKAYWTERGFGYSRSNGFGDEEHLVRLSHLKKFFQSKMFVDVEKGATAKQLAEPFATAGAGLAGLWAAFFAGKVNPQMADMGLGGSAVLASGVFAYVMRDRIKDWAKIYFTRQASHYFPDHRQRLSVEKNEIGKTKEWLRLIDRKSLPQEILTLRRESNFSELENELPEDVVHYRVERQMKSVVIPGVGKDWAFQDVLRVNMNRYLSGLDDAYKEIATFDPVGELGRNRCHRAYPLTMVLVSRSACWEKPARRRWLEADKGENTTSHLICRVWLDKTGVSRVERLKSSTKLPS